VLCPRALVWAEKLAYYVGLSLTVREISLDFFDRWMCFYWLYKKCSRCYQGEKKKCRKTM